jgi:hypothetical protein
VDVVTFLESVIYRHSGTRAEAFAAAARGGLAASVELMETSTKSAVVTGFTVPTARGLHPETDGPPGAAALAAYLTTAGDCCLVTDEPNEAVCTAALSAYDPERNVDVVVAEAGDAEAVERQLRDRGTDSIIFVERLGPNRSGRYLSMRGVDLTEATAPLDRLIRAGDWVTIGVGDGGNEIGMGLISAADLAAVPLADSIHCVSSTDALIVGGTSNWAAWALVAALDIARGGPTTPDALSAELLTTCLDRMLAAGAVDGVSGEPGLTVDGFELDIHHQMLVSIATSKEFDAA